MVISTRTSPAVRQVVELGSEEAFALLATAPFGRIVFTDKALPMIRTVNHLIDQGEIVIRTRLGASVIDALADLESPTTVVAYQADDIDPVTRLGWSVVATGLARPITDPARISLYQGTLQPWIDRTMDILIGIQPKLITGIRLVKVDQTTPG